MEIKTPKIDLTFKMCIFGDSHVGKSTLINRYITAKFDHDLKSTLGAAILMKFIETETTRITLQIWDFGGENRFTSLLPSYAQGSSAAIFMCDISNHDSITNIDKWFLKFNEGLNNRDPKFPLIIVGGKLDLEEQRSFNKKDIETIFTVRKEFDYLECSSKTGENVNLLFKTIVDKVLIYRKIKPSIR
ncbi:MAG: GTP-binding protein [Candidatus Lokiarchaeota archaeon]|nr:GTP-binding protein [Candidatus Lokiarchaeota archaeon]